VASLHHLGCYYQTTNSTVSHSTKGLKQVQVTVLTNITNKKGTTQRYERF